MTLENILREQLLAALLAQIPDRTLLELVDEIARRDLDPYSAAERLMPALVGSPSL